MKRRDILKSVALLPLPGIDINEKEAAKYPLPKYNYNWTQVRKNDGTSIRP